LKLWASATSCENATECIIAVKLRPLFARATWFLVVTLVFAFLAVFVVFAFFAISVLHLLVRAYTNDHFTAGTSSGSRS
jgi:hypothetical protein